MDLDAMLDSFFAALKDVLKSASDAQQRRAPLLPLKQDAAPTTPAELNTTIGVSLGRGAVPAADYDEVLRMLQLTLRHSVNTNSPLFINRLYSGAELAGVLAEFLVVALNTSAGAWDVSPVFSLMEREVVNRFLFHVGFPSGCGVFCPGGSMANLYGMHVARERAIAHGHKLSRLVAVCGTQAHYSVDKSARLIGLDYWQLVKVASDCNGRVIASELARALQQILAEGNVPFFCHLTSGTTVMGAFDELEPLIAVCRKFDHVWVHVDAAWGGSVLLSEEHKHLMAGVEESDSVAWCAHKMIGAPLHASVALFRSSDALRAGFDCNTPYIYQKDASVSEESFQLDLMGKHTFQCSRPADSVKVWFIWRHLGSEGLAQKVNHVFAMAKHLVQLILSPKFSRNFRLVHNAPQFTNVCFWFLPDQHVDAFATDFEEREGRLFGPEKADQLRYLVSCVSFLLSFSFVGSVTSAVRAEMLNRGQLMLGYSTLSIQSWAMPNFFRFVAVGRQIGPEHLVFALEHLREIGNQIYK